MYSQVLRQGEPHHICSESEAQEDDLEQILGSSHKCFQDPIQQCSLVSIRLSYSLEELNWYQLGSKRENLTAKLCLKLSLSHLLDDFSHVAGATKPTAGEKGCCGCSALLLSKLPSAKLEQICLNQTMLLCSYLT